MKLAEPMPADVIKNIETSTDKLFQALTGPHGSPDYGHGLCLYWANAAVMACNRQGIRAVLQAGTANWKANDNPPPEPTHVGHFWQDHPIAIVEQFLDAGLLPEIHVWAAAPEWGVILDPTTRFVKQLAIDSMIDWTEPDPPHYLIDNQIPPDWLYEPSPNATALALGLSVGILLTRLRKD